MKYLLIILFTLFFTNVSYTQVIYGNPSNYQSLGVFFDYNYNYHFTKFSELPGVENCCPNFSNGTGMGLSIGLAYQFPITNYISAGLKFGYYFINGNMKAPEFEYINIDDVLEYAEIEHSLDANFVSMGFEPFLNFRIYKDFSISMSLKTGYLIQKEYYQVEKLVYPVGRGTFENGSRFRNESSGDINDANNFLMFFSGGFNYDFPINKEGTIIACPSIIYSYGLNNILKEQSWKISFLRFGITIKYIPGFELDTPLEAN